MLRRFIVPSLLVLVVVAIFFTVSAAVKKDASTQQPLTVTITLVGPDQTTLDARRASLLTDPAVLPYLKGTRNKVIFFELLDNGDKGPGRPAPPDRFRATIVSYGNNRAITAEGRFDSSALTITELTEQPDSSPEEFDDAVAILMRDSKYGAQIRSGALRAYRPMPPIASGDKSQGIVGRTVNVGLYGGGTNEIIGINMAQQTIIKFKNNAPPTALAAPTACGVAGSGQGTTGRGTAGQYDLVVSQGGIEIWRMTIIRPSASSGTRGSGVELRNVDYRGKRLFGRAHAPVLNVQYVNNACGPYRDWQYSEGFFVANGVDVAPGIRQCIDQPQTILQSLNDTGNFRGVAVYTSGNETLITTEMEAGWYRYISEWHFFTDGTVEPRFGFGAVNSSCVCNVHNHHVFFRFDFDIGGATEPNVVYGPGLRWWPNPIPTEARWTRTAGNDNTLRILNPATGDGYSIIPPLTDGIADTYGRLDYAVLRGKGTTEFDDGHNSTGTSTEIDLDPFINGESVQGKDVVIWYGAHFVHDVSENLDHYVGPQLVPIQW